MKILYSIQGTGNGHVSRAREIIPYLKHFGAVDLLISGTQADVNLEQDIKYQYHGFGFVFGEKGGVDFAQSWKELEFTKFIKNCRNLPVENYQVIINDFEPITSWSCKLKKIKSIGLSHQCSYLSPKTPNLQGFHWGKQIMNYYAAASSYIGFHFEKYDDFIYTPVIRSEIRNLKPENFGHYTVYLPSYSDAFIKNLVQKHPQTKWEIFSKHTSGYYEEEGVKIFPIHNEKFQKSLEKCTGFLTGGGFEGPAEALFLGKKLLVVPMKNQFEQQCNALALEKMGIEVVWHEAEFAKKLKKFIDTDEFVQVNYPDETEKIIKSIFDK